MAVFSGHGVECAFGREKVHRKFSRFATIRSESDKQSETDRQTDGNGIAITAL